MDNWSFFNLRRNFGNSKIHWDWNTWVRCSIWPVFALWERLIFTDAVLLEYNLVIHFFIKSINNKLSCHTGLLLISAYFYKYWIVTANFIGKNIDGDHRIILQPPWGWLLVVRLGLSLFCLIMEEDMKTR